MKKIQTFRLIGLLLAIVLIAAACADRQRSEASRSEALQDETVQADRVGNRYNDTQPVPEFEWSQQRQNLIELLTAQARTTATTTFFFHLGADTPVAMCPSIGFPIPATYQLTNPSRGIEVETYGSGANPAVGVSQLEATGVYTADTTGTYVMCVNSDGAAFARYWEGYVMTDTGTSEFVEGQVALLGDPTFDFSESR